MYIFTFVLFTLLAFTSNSYGRYTEYKLSRDIANLVIFLVTLYTLVGLAWYYFNMSNILVLGNVIMLSIYLANTFVNWITSSYKKA